MVYREQHLDATFGALADPTRRQILARLARGDETIKELAGRFTMSLPAVSKHVRVLERAGLVRVRQLGRARHTSIVAAPMRKAASWIEEYRALWEHQFDRLEQYLNSTAPTTAEATAWPDKTPKKRHLKSAARSTPRASASTRRGPNPKNSSDGARRGK